MAGHLAELVGRLAIALLFMALLVIALLVIAITVVLIVGVRRLIGKLDLTYVLLPHTSDDSRFVILVERRLQKKLLLHVETTPLHKHKLK